MMDKKQFYNELKGVKFIVPYQGDAMNVAVLKNSKGEMLLPAFKHNHHNPELKNKILACSSTENNLRMYSQYSNFPVHNSLERLEDICDENMLYKIIIPSGRKQYFIESLRVFGISESFVYPDLDHISNDLKDSYGI